MYFSSVNIFVFQGTPHVKHGYRKGSLNIVMDVCSCRGGEAMAAPIIFFPNGN